MEKRKSRGPFQQSFVYKDPDKQARCIPSRLISITYRQEMEEQQRKDKDTPFQMKYEVEQDCNHVMAVLAMGSNSIEQGLKREKMMSINHSGIIHSEVLLLADEGSDATGGKALLFT